MKSTIRIIFIHDFESPPSRGAWIEMTSMEALLLLSLVAPLAGGVD